MNITKHSIQSSARPTQAFDILCKINYIQIEDADGFNRFCLEIAENLFACCTDGITKLVQEVSGTLVAVNEMSVSHFDTEKVSLKCDFTVSQSSVLLFHRRYAVNYLLSHDILLIPQLIKGLGRCHADSFFLTSQSEKLYAVPILKRSAETPLKLSRKSKLDALCNGKPREVKIMLPHCLSVQKH